MQFKGTQLGICSTRLGSDRYADFSFKARVCRGIGKGRQQRTFKCFKLQPSLMSVVWTTFIVYSIGRVLSPHDACWAQQNGDHLGLLGFFLADPKALSRGVRQLAPTEEARFFASPQVTFWIGLFLSL